MHDKQKESLKIRDAFQNEVSKNFKNTISFEKVFHT